MKVDSLGDVLDWFCDSHHSCGSCDFSPQSKCPVWWLKSKIDDKLIELGDPFRDMNRDISQLKFDVAKLAQHKCKCGEPKLYTSSFKDNVEKLKEIGKELFEP